ncbi:MAG: leucine-rich repeat domain-containing protein [Bacteroidales bacterium]|nr:leucine-rich repeat domain-containing protein [Bacteroidales bacterium]
MKKTLHLKKALRTSLFVLLLSVVGMAKGYAQDFYVDGLNYTINDDGVSVTVSGEYGMSYEPLVIPESVENDGVNYAVTTIGDNAFSWYNSSINVGLELVIPNSIVKIGESAFSGSYNLTRLTIGNSVAEIGNDAFSDCGIEGELVIPNSVTTIGNAAFCRCEGFSGSLTLGNSVTTIGNYAFQGCGFTGDLNLPGSVTTIGEAAFYNCGFTGSLAIPNTITTIGDYTFGWCEGFTGELVIPNSVNSIGYGALAFCEGFTGSLVIPNSVATIGDYAFQGCTGFSGLIIGNAVTTIGEAAFQWCSEFTTITISNSVATIGCGAFYGCEGLTTLTIPNSVTRIIGNPFSYCDGLGQITVESGNTVYDSRGNCNAIVETASNTLVVGCKNTVVPNTITTIGENAFEGCVLTSVVLPASVTAIKGYAYSGCSNLTSVNIPNHVVSIGQGVFSGCNGIDQITVEEGNPVYDSRNNCNAIIETGTNTLIQGCKNTMIPNSVTKIGNSSFHSCSGLTSIEIPDSVLEIGDAAFLSSGLSGKLTIGNSVTRIGDDSFFGCYDLTSIEIGNSLTRIGKRAFMYCDNFLGDLIIPNSVTCIDEMAFESSYEGCFGGNLVLGNTLDSIGQGAFRGCSFNTVVSLNAVPPTYDGWGAFDCYPYPDLIVRCGSKEAYEAVPYWANFVSSIEEDCSPHNVNIDENNMSGGNVSASVSSTELGEEVQLTVTPDEGMELALITVSNANDPSQTVPVYPIGRNNSIYAFIMPHFDVVVSAAFTVSSSVNEDINTEACIYPNPTNGPVTIEVFGLHHVSIFNAFGQQVYDGAVDGDIFEYDFSGHEAGIYLIRMETANGVAAKRLIVTK